MDRTPDQNAQLERLARFFPLKSPDELCVLHPAVNQRDQMSVPAWESFKRAIKVLDAVMERCDEVGDDPATTLGRKVQELVDRDVVSLAQHDKLLFCMTVTNKGNPWAYYMCPRTSASSEKRSICLLGGTKIAGLLRMKTMPTTAKKRLQELRRSSGWSES